jgi:hypothetical protein
MNISEHEEEEEKGEEKGRREGGNVQMWAEA